MNQQVINLILNTVKGEQRYLTPHRIEKKHKGYMRSIRLKIAEESLKGETKTYKEQVEEIMKSANIFNTGKKNKLVKSLETSLSQIITEYFARFPAEQYKDYQDVKSAQVAEYKRRYQDFLEMADMGIPEEVSDTYIPQGYMIDYELSDKKHTNTVYFNGAEKIVIWTLKGVDFGEVVGGRDMNDVWTILTKDLTDWATDNYYDYLQKIIEKYVYGYKNMGWKIYMSSHSRGAAVQLALLVTDWYSNKPVDLTKNGTILFNTKEYPIQDFSQYIEGAFLYTPAFPPWGTKDIDGFLKNKQSISKDKIKKLDAILHLGFVTGSGILTEGRGGGAFSIDPISHGAIFNEFPYGKKFYSKQREWLPHTILNFLSEYVTNLQPIEKQQIKTKTIEVKPAIINEYNNAMSPDFFPITLEEEKEIFDTVERGVNDLIEQGSIDKKDKDEEIERIVKEIQDGIIERERERIISKSRMLIEVAAQPNLINKNEIIDTSGLKIIDENIYAKNIFSDIIDIDMSFKYDSKKVDKKTNEYNRGWQHKKDGKEPKSQAELKFTNKQYNDYLGGINSESYKSTATIGAGDKQSILNQLEAGKGMFEVASEPMTPNPYGRQFGVASEPMTPAPKFQQGRQGATQRNTAPKQAHSGAGSIFASQPKEDTIEKKVARDMGFFEPQEFKQRVRVPPKLRSFEITPEGELKKTYGTGAEQAPVQSVFKQRMDKHIGNKLTVPTLPVIENTKKEKTQKKPKQETTKKITKATKIYKL